MNIRFCLSKISTAVLTGSLLTLSALASTQIPNEFWISTNATGNIYPNGGTLDNPLDGSTASNFDANMAILCNGNHPNSTIHILAGTYQTKGSETWQIRGVAGQRILGSGIDVTILTLVADSDDPEVFCINTCCGLSTNIEVADMTVNANYSGGAVNRHGISLYGTGIAVRRVKVIHCGYDSPGNNSEAWGISIDGGGTIFSAGNVIESCEVSQFLGPLDFITAIGIGAGEGVIRDNRVFLSPTGAENAISPSGNAGPVLIEGNYVNGAESAVYGDTGGCTNIIIAHNNFINCNDGVTYYGSQRRNITVAFNNITLASGGAAAINFWNGGDPNVSVTNVLITGNTIDVAQPTSGSPFLVAAANVTGLLCYGNSINGILVSNQMVQGTSYFAGNSNVNIYDNFDLLGNPLANWQQSPSGKSFDILPPDAFIQPWGLGSVTVGGFYYGNEYYGWCCSSNAEATIIKTLPSPADFWNGDTTFVTSWKICTTRAGTYFFDVGLNYMTNGVSGSWQQTLSFTAPSGPNITTIAATNTIPTANVDDFQTWLWTAYQVQPGDYYILSGKVTGQ